MRVRETEAERLRRLRLTFERAMRDRIGMDEAARRIARDALDERQRRYRQLQRQRDAAEHGADRWWQQGQYA